MSANAPRDSAHPNVLVVLTDQQRWDTVGAYGGPMGLMPWDLAHRPPGTYNTWWARNTIDHPDEARRRLHGHGQARRELCPPA